ncbi:hypothetical protein PGT21_031848 [Puccinia graminis f. sp. tritici]|uniref:Uncharacterized protein n=1 Tax=Puccinia graminis f. sp. tritici TaxID=56615 RepID=A0A5B0PVI5_PUCGR|nr:hypothetical protein PGT21_031848 [Puccinia graminis f. sp. tritici]
MGPPPRYVEALSAPRDGGWVVVTVVQATRSSVNRFQPTSTAAAHHSLPLPASRSHFPPPQTVLLPSPNSLTRSPSLYRSHPHTADRLPAPHSTGSCSAPTKSSYRFCTVFAHKLLPPSACAFSQALIYRPTLIVWEHFQKFKVISPSSTTNHGTQTSRSAVIILKHLSPVSNTV